jgi:hypothetical protein
LQSIRTGEGVLELSIFEAGVPPRFRLSGVTAGTVTVQTRREPDERHDFMLANHGTYWESVEEIPEPHQFKVSVIVVAMVTWIVTRPNSLNTTMLRRSSMITKRRRRMTRYTPPSRRDGRAPRHVHNHRHGRGK